MKLLALAAVLLGVLALAPSAHAGARPPVDFELAPSQAPASAASAGGGYLSRPLRTPRRFNLVGLRWRGTHAPGIELRTRSSGTWSRWVHLDAHADHNPDLWRGEGLVTASDPIWVGRAGAVQYRLSRRVPGLRLHFVDTGPLPAPRARSAQAPPAYVSRADWGAAACPPRSAPGYGTVRAVHVHHTVSLNDYSPEEAPAVVLAICRYHRNSNGWDDIGYNALVDRFGTLYEGRAGGLDRAVIGAQAQGFNSQTAGIATIGDHSAVEETPEALTTLASYIRWKLAVHAQPLSGLVTLTSSGGSATRYPAGARVTLERVIGHRDTGRTACPGDALYAQLPELRTLVETGAALPSVTARVSATLADDRLDYGEVLPVGGTLAAPDGAPLAGETVELQVNGDGAWRTVRRLVTDAGGTFAGDLKPRRRTYVRVRWPGRADLRGSSSARLLVRLRPVITLDESLTRGSRGVPVPVSGTVGPHKRVVYLVLQQRIRGRFRTVGARAVRTRRGRFSSSFVPQFSAAYRFYVVARADLDTDRGVSELRILRVTRSRGVAPATGR